MKVEGGLFGKRKGGGQETVMGSEHDQGVLYMCMKMS
jgi:hypothetical protein